MALVGIVLEPVEGGNCLKPTNRTTPATETVTASKASTNSTSWSRAKCLHPVPMVFLLRVLSEMATTQHDPKRENMNSFRVSKLQLVMTGNIFRIFYVVWRWSDFISIVCGYHGSRRKSKDVIAKINKIILKHVLSFRDV